MSDLKGQVKMLEEKNTSYMQKNMDLEEVNYYNTSFSISLLIILISLYLHMTLDRDDQQVFIKKISRQIK